MFVHVLWVCPQHTLFIFFILISHLMITISKLICLISLCRGVGYPDLWPSLSCKEPLDVSKNFTFDVVSGILTGQFYDERFNLSQVLDATNSI